MAKLLFKRKSRNVGNNEHRRKRPTRRVLTRKGILSKKSKTKSSKQNGESVDSASLLGSSDVQQLFAIQEMLQRLVFRRSGTTQLQLIMSGVDIPNVLEWAASIRRVCMYQEPIQDMGFMQKCLQFPEMNSEFELELYQSEFGEWRLICSSWMRGVYESSQKHELTMARGVIILDEGFEVACEQARDSSSSDSSSTSMTLDDASPEDALLIV